MEGLVERDDYKVHLEKQTYTYVVEFKKSKYYYLNPINWVKCIGIVLGFIPSPKEELFESLMSDYDDKQIQKKESSERSDAVYSIFDTDEDDLLL